MAVQQTASSLDKLEAVVRNSAVYKLAKVIPERQPGEGGRPFEFRKDVSLVCAQWRRVCW